MIPEVRIEKGIERAPRLSLDLATSSSVIAAAQRLRLRVFVEEMGALTRAATRFARHFLPEPEAA